MLQITDVLKAKKGMEILELFLDNPEADFYQTEILKKLKFSPMTIIKWLKILIKSDLLKLKIRGRLKYYKLNEINPVAKQLKVLITVAKLYKPVRELKEKNIEIYLYGSAARGEDTAKSDIDILIIGKIDRKRLVKLVEKAGLELKKHVKPLLLTPLEYSSISKKDKIFYENLERNKIRLL